jgi:hypothetical protein
VSEADREEKRKPVTLEDVAEETGEVIGTGLKKAWNILESFGRGVADTLESADEPKEPQPRRCPHCRASAPPRANYCARCGTKL